jgi:hypothetical protein
MTMHGLSYWQAESEGVELLDTTIGDLLDRAPLTPRASWQQRGEHIPGCVPLPS